MVRGQTNPFLASRKSDQLQEFEETTRDELTARSTQAGDLQNAWHLLTYHPSALTWSTASTHHCQRKRNGYLSSPLKLYIPLSGMYTYLSYTYFSVVKPKLAMSRESIKCNFQASCPCYQRTCVGKMRTILRWQKTCWITWVCHVGDQTHGVCSPK